MIYVWTPHFVERERGTESPDMGKAGTPGFFRPLRAGEVPYNHVPVPNPSAWPKADPMPGKPDR